MANGANYESISVNTPATTSNFADYVNNNKTIFGYTILAETDVTIDGFSAKKTSYSGTPILLNKIHYSTRWYI